MSEKTRKTDRRTLYTKKVIQEAFLTELKHKPYNKITVTDITRLAEINRSTFYLHYVDAIAVFDELLNELLAELMCGLDDVVKNSGSVEAVLGHSEEIYKRILDSDTQIFLLEKGLEYPAFIDDFSAEFTKRLLPLIPGTAALKREDLSFVMKGLMYSYLQLDIHYIRKFSLHELEHFNALLNTYLIAPCMARLMQ